MKQPLTVTEAELELIYEFSNFYLVDVQRELVEQESWGLLPPSTHMRKESK